MLKMLIIADDFTGALDTGVKFAEVGAHTTVSTDINMNFSEIPDGEILVLCVPTRHLPPQEAYRVTRRIVERAADNTACIFKKTDSALRGNVGAELQGALDGSGQKEICFMPALPNMNRTTKKGIHYIDGVPVSKSAFGKDPFDPVTEDYIPALLGRQCQAGVEIISRGQALPARADEATILVFDCLSQADMQHSVCALQKESRMKLMAGCAGLAQSLAATMKQQTVKKGGSLEKRLLVICGSVNPISTKQFDYAEGKGIPRIHLPGWFLLNKEPIESGENGRVLEELLPACQKHEMLLLDSLQTGEEKVLSASGEYSLEEIRQQISHRLGKLLKVLMERGVQARFMIVGGDTLLAFMEAVGCNALSPLYELESGVVLSQINYRGKTYEIISKSGGFGNEDLLLSLQ